MMTYPKIYCKTMAHESNPNRAFAKGYQQLRLKDVKEARAALCAILGVTTQPALRNYMFGRIQRLDVETASQIEALFLSYGIENPWGL